jgi:hypothetical protein
VSSSLAIVLLQRWRLFNVLGKILNAHLEIGYQLSDGVLCRDTVELDVNLTIRCYPISKLLASGLSSFKLTVEVGGGDGKWPHR